MKKSKAGRKGGGVRLIIGVIMLAMAAGCAVYINDYYQALPEAMAVMEQAPEGVTILKEENKQIVFMPEEVAAGLIFYPGGKVQYEAYAPLMAELAEQGILCVLLHMPGNLAVLDMNAADGIVAQYPEVETWYIGGHSLGGSMAASYIDKHADEFEGLVLLAAYSTADLTDDDLEIIAIYGTEDQVLNAEKYEEYRGNLPEDFHEEIIEGGNHAYFGTYGHQEGDGEARITNAEQIQYTVDVLVEQMKFVSKCKKYFVQFRQSLGKC